MSGIYADDIPAILKKICLQRTYIPVAGRKKQWAMVRVEKELTW